MMLGQTHAAFKMFSFYAFHEKYTQTFQYHNYYKTIIFTYQKINDIAT
jgi:hypothetical protein